MITSIVDVPLQGIGQLLVSEHLLDKQHALQLYQNALQEQCSFIRYLVKNHIVTAKQIATIVAQKFDVPMMDIDSISIDSLPLHLLNESLIQYHEMIPLAQENNHLYIATDDPGKQSSLKEIQFHTGLEVHPIVVETDKLSALIHHLISIKETKKTTKSAIALFSEQPEDNELINTITNDKPIIKLVNQLLFEAHQQGASDIHFECYEHLYRIRLRKDGILHEINAPPLSLAVRINARIKILANLDISERRLPQDGYFKMFAIEFRVNICPTINGEKIVIRILDAHKMNLSLSELGFSHLQQEQFLAALKKPQGMILITGPTGSGKTVSLYSALNLLNTSQVNITTIEDPVEIKLEGVNQVSINSKIEFNFAHALRSFLRQDPDIIMIGELRDNETADIAIKAAQTGHLVLSTLHTNSASQTLSRLMNMGISTFNLVHAVTLIIAQRLIRTLCPHCKIPTEHRAEQHSISNKEQQVTLYKAGGCAQCSSGYNGRIGLYEVLPLTNHLKQMIINEPHSFNLLAEAQKEGMSTLYQMGLEQVKRGVTTIEEINRVVVD